MKKTLIALCGALTLAAFADPAEPAPSAEAQAPRRPSAEAGARPMRGPMQRPPMLTIGEKTTAEEIAAFKAEVAKKIDETAAAYAAKSGEDKKPVRIVLFTNEGMGPRQGMGPRGEGRGPRGEGMGPRGEGRGPRGDRPRRNRGGDAEAPKPAAEAK